MWPISIDKIVHLLAYNPKEPLIFSSGFFIWWFLLFISGFALVQKQHRAKIIFVTLFSLFFYYKSSGVYFLVLIGSTII